MSRIVKVSRPHMPGYGVLPAEEGRGLLPFEWASERLARSRNYWVSTVRPDGLPHLMPVWGVFVDNVFTFSTGERTRKARNLRQQPECVISVEDASEPVILEGAVNVWEPSAPREVHEAYKQKYGLPIDGQPGVIFRVTPRVVIGFIEAAEEFSDSATRWEFAS